MDTKFYNKPKGVPDIQSYIKDSQYKNHYRKEDNSLPIGNKFQPMYVSQIHIAPSDEKIYAIPAHLIQEEEMDGSSPVDSNQGMANEFESKIYEKYGNPKDLSKNTIVTQKVIELTQKYQRGVSNALKTVTSESNEIKNPSYANNVARYSKDSAMTHLMYENENPIQRNKDQPNKKAKILIKTPLTYESNQRMGPRVEFNTRIGEENNRQSIDISEIDQLDYKNSGSEFFRVPSQTTAERFYVFQNEIRPVSSGYPTHSNIPVVHNYVIKFDEHSKKNRVLTNKYNALKETKEEIIADNNKKPKLIVWDKNEKKW